MSFIAQDLLQAVVGSIPPGRWVSYSDVARVCGGTDRHARTLNQRFIRHPIPGAHRVLLATGAVGATALGDPDGVRGRLEAEGLRFVDDRADCDARTHIDELLEQRAPGVAP